MPRTATAPGKSSRANQGLELAQHKNKIRNQKEELDKLKRALKTQSVVVANLERANKYLLQTAEPKKKA
jgi:hypothetical protein